jgi:hypothetical protein
MKFEEKEIPAEMVELCKCREQMISGGRGQREAHEKYLGGEELTVDEIRPAARTA